MLLPPPFIQNHLLFQVVVLLPIFFASLLVFVLDLWVVHSRDTDFEFAMLFRSAETRRVISPLFEGLDRPSLTLAVSSLLLPPVVVVVMVALLYVYQSWLFYMFFVGAAAKHSVIAVLAVHLVLLAGSVRLQFLSLSGAVRRQRERRAGDTLGKQLLEQRGRA